MKTTVTSLLSDLHKWSMLWKNSVFFSICRSIEHMSTDVISSYLEGRSDCMLIFFAKNTDA
jgi:hypothetical protein